VKREDSTTTSREEKALKKIFGAILAAGLALSALTYADTTTAKSPFTVEEGAHMTPAQRKAAYTNWMMAHKKRHRPKASASGAKGFSAASVSKTGHP
jgi:hypothetical protein